MSSSYLEVSERKQVISELTEIDNIFMLYKFHTTTVNEIHICMLVDT